MVLKRHKLDRSQPVRQQAADVVQDAIMKGLLLPGEKLRQRMLAVQFRLSHSAVREVLLELENRGLITKRGSSYAITLFSESEFLDLTMMRQLLEPVACRLAAIHWHPDLNDNLESCLERMQKAFDERNLLVSWECDRDFHRIIWHHQPNRILEAHLEKVCTQLFAFYLSPHVAEEYYPVAPFQRIFAEHRTIVNVLRTRDGELTERVVRRILLRASRKTSEVWRELWSKERHPEAK